MRIRMAVVVVSAVFVALALISCPSASAETRDFLKLVSTGTPQSVQSAIDNGADITVQDKNGVTALNPKLEVISTLLKTGADGKAKDNEGKTAFDYAQDNEKLKGTDAYRQLQKASQ